MYKKTKEWPTLIVVSLPHIPAFCQRSPRSTWHRWAWSWCRDPVRCCLWPPWWWPSGWPSCAQCHLHTNQRPWLGHGWANWITTSVNKLDCDMGEQIGSWHRWANWITHWSWSTMYILCITCCSHACVCLFWNFPTLTHYSKHIFSQQRAGWGCRCGIGSVQRSLWPKEYVQATALYALPKGSLSSLNYNNKTYIKDTHTQENTNTDNTKKTDKIRGKTEAISDLCDHDRYSGFTRSQKFATFPQNVLLRVTYP